MTAWCR
ncbi:hypothetical protein E2C01_076591 [Portunus trituberculatus]|nr:hypothetical protein [Portunus trituberculatus]